MSEDICCGCGKDVIVSELLNYWPASNKENYSGEEETTKIGLRSVQRII